MPARAVIELHALELATDLGTYEPDDVVPDAHLLDLTLGIDPSCVLIAQDGMTAVFDYDPLIAEIDRLARDGHYETQERLMTRILDACARHREIESVEIALRKRPVLAGSGSLGVRVSLDAEALAARRDARAA